LGTEDTIKAQVKLKRTCHDSVNIVDFHHVFRCILRY